MEYTSQRMHKDSIERVDRHMGAGSHPHYLMLELKQLLLACDRALSEPKLPPQSPRGAPSKDLARWVACSSAETYLDLTGIRPTVTTGTATGLRSGNFVDFVALIFKELGVKEKPTEWAKVACDALRNRRILPTSLTFTRPATIPHPLSRGRKHGAATL